MDEVKERDRLLVAERPLNKARDLIGSFLALYDRKVFSFVKTFLSDPTTVHLSV